VTRPTSLALIFASLTGSGCILTGTSCPDADDTYTSTQDIEVAIADYEAALGEGDTLSAEDCMALCRANWYFPEGIQSVDDCEDLTQDDDELATLSCTVTEQQYCEGRAHQAVARQRLAGGLTPEARWLARATHAEASSVGAFLALARELQDHGAPAELVERARDAARDELVHARIIGGLARQAGGACQALRFDAPPHRSLEALAIENAVEGCVGETWSALLATWQATHAPTAELRATFTRIARDETRHAELARDLHTWAVQRLDPDARDRVARAFDQAWERLEHSLSEHAALPALGLPDRDQAHTLARGLRAACA